MTICALSFVLQVMEWEEFTGFVIDQVLALTREAPRADRLRIRPLGARDRPSVSRCVPTRSSGG